MTLSRALRVAAAVSLDANTSGGSLVLLAAAAVLARAAAAAALRRGRAVRDLRGLRHLERQRRQY